MHYYKCPKCGAIGDFIRGMIQQEDGIDLLNNYECSKCGFAEKLRSIECYKWSIGDWQPIETAPKNERILLYGKHYSKKTVAIGKFIPHQKSWYFESGIEFRPIYWMPLPNLPED